ncbi:MAG: hypothetical protein HYX68_25135 [Planctomycetes bacterium]|nr:hypothetical protein [Planctomycetota bacterium]
MRIRLMTSLFLLLGLVLPIRAQEPIETASNGMITDALERLNGRFSLEEDHYAIQLKNRTYRLYRLDAGKRLLIKAGIKSQPSLAVLNRYNEKIAVTTRAVRYEKTGVFLEAGLDCQLGVTQTSIAKFVTRFTDDVVKFEAFLAKNPGVEDVAQPVGDPKVAPVIGKRKVPFAVTPGSDDKEFVITFPTADPQNWETAWKVVWDMETAKHANDQGFKFPKGRGNASVLFKIKKAYFKPGQKAEWIQVLDDAHPSEFYVPYYFRGTRFYDLRSVGGYVPLSAKEGGAVSQVLSKSRRVIAELRDTGPAYKHGSITRRGEELTLFANFGAANYTYMIEYGFKDDGGIVFRHSPTGYNFFSHFDATHMHGSFWRIGMKLGPDGNNDTNQVFITGLPTNPRDQGDGGKLDIKEVTTESFHDWNPAAFTRIRVTNPNYSIVPEGKGRPALPISYDLVTTPQGLARHKRFKDEKFTHHDFWITRQDCPEKMYVYLGNHFFTPDGNVNPNLAKLDKKNAVIWHSSSALHVPRAEDGILKGNSTANGQATIYWTTFELRPRNLFLRTPIYRASP